MQHLEESVVFQTLFYAQTFQQGLTLTQLWQRLLVGKKELTFEEFIAQLQQLQAQGFIQEKNKRYFYLLQEKSVNSHKIWQKKYTLATQAAAKIIPCSLVPGIPTLIPFLIIFLSA